MSLVITITKAKNGMYGKHPMMDEEDHMEENGSEGEGNEEDDDEEDGEEEDSKYESNAKFEHYRGILTGEFKKKFPSEFDKFMSGLNKVQDKDPDMVEDYIESSPMDKFLSEDEIKNILKSDFEDYAKVASKITEGDISFGKKLLATPIKTSYEKKSENGSEDRMFYYDQQSKGIQKMIKKNK